MSVIKWRSGRQIAAPYTSLSNYRKIDNIDVYIEHGLSVSSIEVLNKDNTDVLFLLNNYPMKNTYLNQISYEGEGELNGEIYQIFTCHLTSLYKVKLFYLMCNKKGMCIYVDEFSKYKSYKWLATRLTKMSEMIIIGE